MFATPAGTLPGRSLMLSWVLALFFAAPGSGRAAATGNELGHPIFREFPPGKSQPQLHYLCQAVTQDSAGFIYLANYYSLRCYDGATWRHIDVPTQSAGIRKFARTPDGTIYAAGASIIGYIRGSGEGAEFVSLADRLPPTELGCDEIFDVLAAGSSVFFADEEKILVWRDQHFSVVPCRSPPGSQGARLHRVGDAVYVTALDRGLCQLRLDKLEPVVDDPVFRQNQIVSIEAGPAGALRLLTARQGFFQLAAGRVAPLVTEANRWLEGKGVLRAQRVADGSLAILFDAPSGYGGLRLGVDGRYLGPLDNTIGLYLKTLRDLFCDREGGLWLGSEIGLFRLEWPSGVTLFDAVNGLGGGAVADAVRHAGVLHAATGEGVFRLIPGDAAGLCARFERISTHPAYALVSHPTGLIALEYAGLSLVSPTRRESIAALPPGAGVLHRSTRDPERIWIGTPRGVQSVRHRSEGWHDEGLLRGFDEDVRGLIEEKDGTLWVSTFNRGLFRLAFNAEKTAGPGTPRIDHFGADRGLPDQFRRINVVDWRGEPLVLLDTDKRPFRFDRNARRLVEVPESAAWPAGPFTDGWAGSRADPIDADALWLSAQSGVYQVPPAGGESRRLPNFITAAAGALARLREEALPDGRVLWICGARGLVRVEVARAFAAPVPFAARLKSAEVREGSRLPHRHAPLKFDYIALRHQFGNTVSYQTRLVGNDEDWSPWSSAQERIFTNLPAGSYRFEIRARDADHQLSAPASLSFAILAPWWATQWALVGYAIAGLVAMAGVVRLRTRALRERASRLEALVAKRTRQLVQRTTELAQKNVELTQLHRLESEERIAARLAEEKARLEVLRYQLNPHFLFNTLASISASLPPTRSDARTMVERLADFCRLTLHRSDERDTTTLGEEMQLLRTYLEIERSRWGDLLELEISCDPLIESERLPHFLLLPLVENALKYGRATSPDRVGLRLVVRREESGKPWRATAGCRHNGEAEPNGTKRSVPPPTILVFEVANTGEWIEPGAKKTVSSLGIGLDNLRERLARYYAHSHELTVAHDGGWVTVTLRLGAVAQPTGEMRSPAAQPRPPSAVV